MQKGSGQAVEGMNIDDLNVREGTLRVGSSEDPQDVI